MCPDHRNLKPVAYKLFHPAYEKLHRLGEVVRQVRDNLGVKGGTPRGSWLWFLGIGHGLG